MLAGKVLKGIGLQYGGRVGGNVIGFASTLIMAYLISPEDFGVFALAMSAVKLSSAFFQFHTTLILIRMDQPAKVDFDTVFTLNLLRGLAVSIVLLLLAWPFSTLLSEPRLLPLVLALAVYPLLLSLRNPYFELYAKDMRFLPGTALEFAMKLATLIASVGVALVFANYWALFAGIVSAGLIGAIATFVMAPGRPGLSLKSWRAVFGFSVWLAFAAIATEASTESQRLIIGAVFGASILGAFAVAAQIVTQVVQALMQPINYTTYSAFSRLKDDKARLRDSFLLAQASLCAVLLPMGAGLILVADEIVGTFLQEKWALVSLFVPFVSANLALIAAAGPFWGLAMALGETRILFYRALASFLVMLSLQVAGLIYADLIGFLVGGLIGSAINTVIAVSMVRSLTGIRLRRLALNTLRPILATALMAGGVLAVGIVLPGNLPAAARLVAEMLAGLVCYSGSVLALWFLTGRPHGHERFVIQRLQAMIGKLRRPRKGAPSV